MEADVEIIAQRIRIQATVVRSLNGVNSFTIDRSSPLTHTPAKATCTQSLTAKQPDLFPSPCLYERLLIAAQPPLANR